LTIPRSIRSFMHASYRISAEKERCLTGSPFDRASRIARDAKAFLSPEDGATRNAAPDAEQPKKARRRKSEQRKALRDKRRELSRATEDLRVAKRQAEKAERFEQVKRTKKKKQEIFRLRNELRTAKRGTEIEPGRLPDFVVIGAPKCGTTFLYHLLTKHPHVDPSAFKELHFFDLLFEEGVEWYRQCFLPPRQRDGRETITGDGTPSYLFHPHVAERMAGVIPDAKLIALLRNPVDRTYSAYHHRARNRDQLRTFEETVEHNLDGPNQGFLSQSIYVEHLLRWSRFFSREQMLLLKSEDFFQDPRQTLKPVLDFLDLPDWEPEASELRDKVNKGGYENRMDPAIRRRLEEYYEPHNQRLYEFLGVDFGW
jgi:hypothetical protein